MCRAAARMFATCGAHVAIMFTPDTLNVSQFTTTRGTFMEFLRAYKAALQSMRARN